MERMEKRGLIVRILEPEGNIPGAKGFDWNDVLREFGPEGFPLPFTFE